VQEGVFVALREGDLDATIVYPASERLRLWMAVKIDVGRRNGCHPFAGRMLVGWAREAEFEEARLGFSVGNVSYPGGGDG
jgi:hypothetical protein